VRWAARAAKYWACRLEVESVTAIGLVVVFGGSSFVVGIDPSVT
jgi:hypothetical protein